MDELRIMKLADMLSIYSYKIDAIINLLIDKNILSKDEINDMLCSVMDRDKRDPETDEYVIDALKDKVLLK